MTPTPPHPAHSVEEPPPFLRSWRRVYTAVLLYLAALIVLFYLFARAFAPPPAPPHALSWIPPRSGSPA